MFSVLSKPVGRPELEPSAEGPSTLERLLMQYILAGLFENVTLRVR